jgi:putative membrane protein
MPFKEVLAPFGQSRTLRLVAVYALLSGGYAALAVWKENSSLKNYADFPSQIHAALTLVLGWLLVFRTNIAYARWWEARTLWGGLVNCCRNLSIKFTRLIKLPEPVRSRVRQLIVNFPQALRQHLRGDNQSADAKALVGSPTPGHMPAAISAALYEEVESLRSAGRLDGNELRVLDLELRNLLEICGGCERIRNTFIVRSYRIFARQCVFLYLATFPWGIVQDFQVWTIPLTAISAYFMLGLETVAEHIEEPFGLDEDDLDLDALCATVERSTGEIFASQQTR